ncbi:hypothetical protein H2199_007817 [Coniosporium tulheliwenetii]|uniref:Uncharacterized protein n=1 Tax=Coniosporium tulheliwenetii TaxID=3383036 RepID=A0ACC2YNG9_9PEZI|nr:hypothetical protein H2199_007817 [Cladosporium sp. JES 115]
MTSLSYVFDFQAFSLDQACGDSNITLNGFPLTQQWDGIHATGQGSFSAVFEQNETSIAHDLSLSWNSSCLFGRVSNNGAGSYPEDVAQVLQVNVQRIDGRPLESPSGFTISFKPLQNAELLRLEPFPDLTAAGPEFEEDWRNPPTHLRLTPQNFEGNHTDEEDSTSDSSSIEQQIEELRLLEAHAKELDRLIQEKKQQIRGHLQQEAKNLKEEVKQCDSILCVVRVIANKAHGTVRVIYLRFRPSSGPLAYQSRHHHPHGGMMEHDAHHHATWKSQHYAALSGDDDNLPPARPHGSHNPQYAHSSEGPPLDAPSSPINPAVVALAALGSILSCGCLFALVNRCCCSLRRRTDRRARREERRTARLYARSARRQAWRDWWTGRHSRGERDYEEKRALILEQEGRLEEAMQEEIRLLREAHEVVTELATGLGFPTTLTPTTSIPIQIHPHTTASPHKQPPLLHLGRRVCEHGPPAYETEEEEDEAGFVADGFREYTPSTTVFTPVSSVLDGSPRQSMDTLGTLGTRGEYEFRG